MDLIKMTVELFIKNMAGGKGGINLDTVLGAFQNLLPTQGNGDVDIAAQLNDAAATLSNVIPDLIDKNSAGGDLLGGLGGQLLGGLFK